MFLHHLVCSSLAHTQFFTICVLICVNVYVTVKVRQSGVECEICFTLPSVSPHLFKSLKLN